MQELKEMGLLEETRAPKGGGLGLKALNWGAELRRGGPGGDTRGRGGETVGGAPTECRALGAGNGVSGVGKNRPKSTLDWDTRSSLSCPDTISH